MYDNWLRRVDRPRLVDTTLASSHPTLVSVIYPLLALFIALLTWLIPNPNLSIKIVLRLSLALLTCYLAVLLVKYVCKWVTYIKELEWRSSQFRKALLSYAGITETVSGDYLEYSVSGIAKRRGTVHLQLRVPDDSGLGSGSVLDVVHSKTGAVYGTVEITTVSDGVAWAYPVDRHQPDFWQQLEDRMQEDPDPPPDVHLERSLPYELRSLLTDPGFHARR